MIATSFPRDEGVPGSIPGVGSRHAVPLRRRAAQAPELVSLPRAPEASAGTQSSASRQESFAAELIDGSPPDLGHGRRRRGYLTRLRHVDQELLQRVNPPCPGVLGRRLKAGGTQPRAQRRIR